MSKELFAAADALTEVVDEYLEGYEFRGENEDGVEADYMPNARERILIEDAVNGLLAEEDFVNKFNLWQDIVRAKDEHALCQLEREVQQGLYYLQDKRTYVGNDMLFWAKGAKGYTIDLKKAEVYTKEQALAQHRCRETDVPWPKDYIDAKTRPAVDMQYVDIDEALEGTGIELIKTPKPRCETYRCDGCGRLMSECQFFSAPCKNCGTDNRP